MSAESSLRHDWTSCEIEAIYTLPLPELVFRAQTLHRAYHRPDEVQGCMLLSIKTGGCPEVVPVGVDPSLWSLHTTDMP